MVGAAQNQTQGATTYVPPTDLPLVTGERVFQVRITPTCGRGFTLTLPVSATVTDLKRAVEKKFREDWGVPQDAVLTRCIIHPDTGERLVRFDACHWGKWVNENLEAKLTSENLHLRTFLYGSPPAEEFPYVLHFPPPAFTAAAVPEAAQAQDMAGGAPTEGAQSPAAPTKG